MTEATRALALGLATLILLCGQARARAEGGDAALGERIYRQGASASGALLTAVVQGDLELPAEQLTCAQCHRDSGYGSSEGGSLVPPITGPILFAARNADRAALFKRLFKESQPGTFSARVRSPRTRPAYTDATLAGAIRDGIDPSGRVLDALMPRYVLGEGDMRHLVEYLRTLSADPDPGVDGETLYLATVVSDGVPAAERDAMLDTVRGFVDWMNLDTAGDLRNPSFSPSYRTDLIDSYRVWELDVWRLEGASETWTAQVDAYYRRRPVFALVGGLVDGPWQPVHEVCERERLPCLFPQTPLPVVGEPNRFSLFLHGGLLLEAEVIGAHLQQDETARGTPGLLQLHVTAPEGSRPAAALASRLGVPTESFSTADELDRRLADLEAAGGVPTLVLWPGHLAAAALDRLASHPAVATTVLLPSTALPAVSGAARPGALAGLRFIYPYELPEARQPRAFRVRAWLRTRGIDIVAPRIQFDTYFALTTLQYGLEHIANDLSRLYLLETIEREAENALNPGTYPRMSLGPGQRFASKGAYIVRLGGEGGAKVEAVSAWIVP